MDASDTTAGVPARGILVKAVDKDLRSEQLLGEAVTNASGDYRIRYTSDRFRRAEKATADLVVRAYRDAEDKGVASPVLFNAPTDAVVDMVVRRVGLTEFELLSEELRPLMDGVGFDEITESEEHQDVTFLSGETGRDTAQIVDFAISHRHSVKTGLPAEVSMVSSGRACRRHCPRSLRIRRATWPRPWWTP